MDELTRVFTVQITGIQKGNIEEMVSKEDAGKRMKEMLIDFFGADDVVVTNVQDFIREVKDNGN